MAIRCIRDILAAHEEGRVHQQPFMKGVAPITNDGQWIDWAYTSGKPAFEPRVGTALEFVPVVASGNDAVYFPPIDASYERRLAGFEVASQASGANQVGVSYMIYDLLGYYPIIDGDNNTDWQDFVTSAPLPRYADGVGVKMALQQYIAPQTGIPTNCTVDYIDETGTPRTTVFQPANVSAGTLTCGAQSVVTGALSSQQSDGARGVRSVTRLRYAGTAIGGLQIMLLYKQIMTGVLSYNDALVVAQTARNTHERCLCATNGFNLPRIYDGASLGIMYMKCGGTVQLQQLFGSFTFIWG